MRAKDQRKAYALRRMSRAVDRVILGDKNAKAWAEAWAQAAGIIRATRTQRRLGPLNSLRP